MPVPEVLLTFLDGEVMRAKAALIDFHQPVLQVEALETRGNNREVTVPLSSLKYVIFGGEAEQELESTHEVGKVVIHFSDHEVLRAYVARDTLGGPFGIIYTLWDPDRKVKRQIGVPYSAVKAIFKVKRWDSRVKTQDTGYRKLARILSEREEGSRAPGSGPQPRRTPLLDRTGPA
ncbi:MAG: hypothetical protein ACYDGR_08745 [Candidatus Dormibacteria bacterium]